MKIKYTNKEIDFKYYDRTTAILIVGKKIYEGNSHQDCFCEYCDDQSLNIVGDYEEFAEITHSLFMNE